MHHSLDLFGVPPIVFPAKGVQLFTSQGLSVLPCYSWSCCGHDKQVPTGRNTLACSYSLVVLLVLNCVQEAVIWGIMRRWQTLESKKHLSWNSQCSERLWTASTGTIHPWHQGLFKRSRCGETTHGSDSLLRFACSKWAENCSWVQNQFADTSLEHMPYTRLQPQTPFGQVWAIWSWDVETTINCWRWGNLLSVIWCQNL